MTEAQMQTMFNRWLRHNWKGGAAAFELKITSKKVINFSQIQPHQEQSLLDAKHGILAYKIADDSQGFKPFDSFVMSQTPAYIVLMFYKPRQQKIAYLIPIDDWIKFKGGRKRGSIDEEHAGYIADEAIDLNEIDHEDLNLTPYNN